MKLCKDCVYFEPLILAKREVCTRAPGKDPVYGTLYYYRARVERAPDGLCGPNAIMFEEKK